MKPTPILILTVALAAGACGQAPPAQAPAPVVPLNPASAEAKAGDPKAAALVLEDQFGRKQDLASYRGDVVILVYGDRRATDACRELGEKLHVLFHPSAKGAPAAKARSAPVAPLEGVAPGARSPDVFVVPVAAVGNVPAVVRDLVRSQVKSAAPHTPVWLDFGGAMERAFGLRAGAPNVVVFDSAGRLSMRVEGAPDQPAYDKLLQAVQNLRAEAAGLAAK